MKLNELKWLFRHYSTFDEIYQIESITKTGDCYHLIATEYLFWHNGKISKCNKQDRIIKQDDLYKYQNLEEQDIINYIGNYIINTGNFESVIPDLITPYWGCSVKIK